MVEYLRDPRLVAKFQGYCGIQIVLPCASKQARDDDGAKSDKGVNGYHCIENYNVVNENSTRWFGRHRTVSFHASKISSKEKAAESAKLTVQTMALIDFFFRFATELGYEPFYITVVPFFIWNIDAFVGRQAVLLWAISMYTGQALKPLIRWPRPASPPVIRLEQNPILELEYGFPSTHSIVSTILPFYTLYLTQGRYEYHVVYGVFIAFMWCVSVSLSRLYLGVHSVMDILGGISLSIVILIFSICVMETVDKFFLYFPLSPLVAMGGVIFALAIYPVEKRWSIDRGDTAAILGSAVGVNIGSWMYHSPDNSIMGPFPVRLASFDEFKMYLLRFFIGVVFLFLDKLIVKRLCLWILPAIMPTGGEKDVSKRTWVELPYKIITYGSIGIGAACFVPLVFDYLDIARF